MDSVCQLVLFQWYKPFQPVLSDLKVRVITSGNQPTADRMVAVKLPALIEVKEKDDGKDVSTL